MRAYDFMLAPSNSHGHSKSKNHVPKMRMLIPEGKCLSHNEMTKNYSHTIIHNHKFYNEGTKVGKNCSTSGNLVPSPYCQNIS